MSEQLSGAVKILAVDDDPSLLTLLAMRLSLEGYQVIEAKSAEQALVLMATQRPNLVITDLSMGGMDGLMLFDHLQQSYPTVPVILLTAYASVPLAVEAMRRGLFGFFTKPFEAEALLAEIKKAIAQSPCPEALSFDWNAAIITNNVSMQAMLSELKMIAQYDTNILVTGASGTGKELVAQAVHKASPRRCKPFLAINCGAIPENLLESELFGHLKGAFTGAAKDSAGLFVAANGGSVFLDEIGDMPMSLQVKLLRVLQEREVKPVGGVTPIPVNVRIIAATHRNLHKAIAEGLFREDLYYRLNVVCLELPPLNERIDDIPLLARHFLKQLAEKYQKSLNNIAPDAMALLLESDWPGNVRQLHNVIEKAVAFATTEIVSATLIKRALQNTSGTNASLDEAKLQFERDYLVRLMKTTQGNVTHAARIAKRNRSEFYNLLRRHGLEPAQFKH